MNDTVKPKKTGRKEPPFSKQKADETCVPCQQAIEEEVHFRLAEFIEVAVSGLSDDLPPPSLYTPPMRLLKRGVSGGDVSSLQQRLIDLVYAPGPVDGIFGPKTDAAVRKFQRDQKLAVDGIVGPNTGGVLARATPQGPMGQVSEKWIKGALAPASDKTKTKYGWTRKEKDGADFKQIINLKADAFGTYKPRADFGRVIKFRARVIQSDSNTDKLSSAKVKFSFECTRGPNAKNTDPTKPVWKAVDLLGDDAAGFGSAGGAKEKIVAPEADGWTPIVEFHTSAFGGDAFKMFAELDEGVPGAETSPKKSGAKYIVWRKFWYQLTFADGYSAVRPEAAESAFNNAYAEMSFSGEKKFKPEDLPAIERASTFYQEFQLAKTKSTKVVGNVGTGNIKMFRTDPKLCLDQKVEEPVKAAVIACEYQIDPENNSGMKRFSMSSKSKIVYLSYIGGSIISKPPVDPGKKLVVSGEFSNRKSPWNKLGSLTDDNLEVVKERKNTLGVKVTLPDSAPRPSLLKPVYIKLEVRTGHAYLGWAPRPDELPNTVVAVYKPGTGSGKASSAEDFADTCAHEFGHKFSQTPEASTLASLNLHPWQYVGHGGSGSHCRYDAKGRNDAANWQDKNETIPEPQDGTCIMYHQYSSKCSHEFCECCQPYLQLERMESLR